MQIWKYPYMFVLKWKQYPENFAFFPSGKYWSPGRPEDVPIQRPQDLP